MLTDIHHLEDWSMSVLIVEHSRACGKKSRVSFLLTILSSALVSVRRHSHRWYTLNDHLLADIGMNRDEAAIAIFRARLGAAEQIDRGFRPGL